MNPDIFKAYDIRGIYPDTLDEEGAYRIGRAFVEFLKVKNVAVGHDMRTSAPDLLPHLFQGINDAGAQVIDLGLIGTELMYFSVGHYGYDSGIMMTASHNPPQYQGMKMVRENSKPIGADTGIYEIRDLAINTDYERLNVEKYIISQDPFEDYKNKINEIVSLSNLDYKKIVVDAGNGMGGILMNKIFGGTNLEIIPMYFEPDGNFPNHEANPIIEDNVSELKQRVVDEKADFGIALDGDGDRAFFIDEKGEYTLGYYLVSVLAEKMLHKYPGGKVVHENRNLWAIQDSVKAQGGVPIKSIAGHTYIKAKMREEDAMFGGETSAHYFYKDLYYADSSMLSIALLLEILTEKQLSLQELLKPFEEKYFISGEFNYKVDNADATLEKVKSHYEAQGFEADELDGIAFDNDRKWHISVRKSNTEPVVRLNVEGESQEIVDKMKEEVEKLITE